MDISQQLPLVLQGGTLLFVVLLLLITILRMSALQKRVSELAEQQQQQAEASRQSLEAVVNEVKDHFEVNLANLASDSNEIRDGIHFSGKQSQRALELQELAFSEATTGNTRIQDLLSDSHRRQQKLIESLTRDSVSAFHDVTNQVKQEIHADLQQHNQALIKMSESAQRMSSNMSAHFNAVGSDLTVLKKAVSAIITAQRAQDEQLTTVLSQSLAPLEASQQQLHHQLEQARSQLQQSLDRSEQAAQSINDLQRAQQQQQRSLLDISDSTNSGLQTIESVAQQQVDMTTFERRYEAFSQELAELSVVMQPLLDSLGDAESASEGSVAAVLLEAVEDIRSVTQAISEDWQSAVNQLTESNRRRHGELNQHIDQVQSNLSSELDGLRTSQRQTKEELEQLQQMLKTL